MSYACRLDAQELADFKAQWPCHGLQRVKTAWFQFDDKGDLVDVVLRGSNGHVLRGALYDGPALAALAERAQRQMHPEHADARYGKRD